MEAKRIFPNRNPLRTSGRMNNCTRNSTGTLELLELLDIKIRQVKTIDTSGNIRKETNIDISKKTDRQNLDTIKVAGASREKEKSHQCRNKRGTFRGNGKLGLDRRVYCGYSYCACGGGISSKKVILYLLSGM